MAGVVTELERQAIVDEKHLRLLPVFYWILGGIDILLSLSGLYGLVFGLEAMLPLEFMVWFLVFGTTATLKILTGFWIRARKRRTACLVVAGLIFLLNFLEIVLSVFTFLVLLRPSVASLFASTKKAEAPFASVTATGAEPEVDDDQPEVS